MISYDIQEHLFDMTDELLSQVIPTYIHQINELNIYLDYIWIDKCVQSSLKISMEDRAIWYYSLDEVIDKAVEEGLLTESHREDYLLETRLGIVSLRDF